ncbi:hypothetical protein NAV33_02750 [Pseudomonas stutzeri]|uniref:hypothetical protein n=1 Tax=Stutzerimonas stutzeri TaxID=316 RepID=UPI002108FFFA|nr:hypothetical protein [Stutzerimonas stutzeri]MCQ4310821.1 hypothetical protein [Stutzerimonas stutzeri]
MHLIQLLLPLYDNDDRPLPKALFSDVRRELIERFGGLTAYTRAPVDGLWLEDGEHAVRDDLVIYEVMAPKLDREWWHDYRSSLETRFRQERIMVRAHRVSLL